MPDRPERTPDVPRRAPAVKKKGNAGHIRAGIGGWTYEPWRNNFYPAGLAHKRELEYASRHVTAIEINGTYYRRPTAASYAKWRDEAPDDFIFTVKVLRYITVRRVLAESGEAIDRFVNTGLAELGDKLGPLLWQFGPTKKFEPDDFARFLELLPAKTGGLPLRHALEVRHPSFKSIEFINLARVHGAAVVFADSDEYQRIADITADFVYARMMKADAKITTGYTPKSLATWAQHAQTWAQGGEPAGLPRIDKKSANRQPRDVFMFFINGAKERAPAAAVEMLRRMKTK